MTICQKYVIEDLRVGSITFNHIHCVLSQLPVSMEAVMDLLNDVNQQLGEIGEAMDEEGRPVHFSPQFTEPAASVAHIKFAPLTPSPSKSFVPSSKRHMV